MLIIVNNLTLVYCLDYVNVLVYNIDILLFCLFACYMFIASDKYVYFSYFSMQTDLVDIYWKHLINPCPAEPGYTLPLQTV